MNVINNLTGAISVLLTLVFGLYLTVKTKGFQFLGLKKSVSYAIKNLFCKSDSNHQTSKGAMCTALAATIGTGNIVGVSGAIALCGAGVVFWISVSSVLAMIIKYIEIYTVVEYRKKENGEYVGGVMYAVNKGLKKSYMPLGTLFAFFTVLASFGTGNLIQVNTAVSSLKVLLSESFLLIDEIVIAVCVLAAFFIGSLLLRGIGAVLNFCEKVIPFMLIFYVAASLYVIIVNRDGLFDVFSMIFKGAFMPKSVTGGIVCSVFLVIKNGVVRGIVSNEAGMGSAAIAHSSASDNKEFEAELGIAEVFIDTLICVLTAFVILLGNKNIVYGKDTGLLSVSVALKDAFGSFSNVILCVFLIVFGLSSVLGWGTYGTVCAEFLWRKKGGTAYKIIFSAICVLGAVISTEKIWSMSEILNSLVSIPNIIAVFLLFKKSKFCFNG